ncbi:MAG: hypothetical protein FJX76_11680 [Armatimonadetes bacterium]|nr:hypothetical protein [Armatimonadota bacterium]
MISIAGRALSVAALFLACVLPLGAASAVKLDYDTAPARVVFSITTKGGVASTLQELTALPDFVLYGDGTAFWTRYDKAADLRQLWTATLSPEQVRAELQWLSNKGYFEWYDRYDHVTIKNLPTTYFQVNLVDGPFKRQVYGMNVGLKDHSTPAGFGEVFERFSKYSAAGEKLYNFDRVMLFARKLTRSEARRGYKTINWGVKQVKLADFARESEKEYGQFEVSGKDASRVTNRLRKWTLFSTDLSIIFFKEKKEEYQLGYRPLLPGD